MLSHDQKIVLVDQNVVLVDQNDLLDDQNDVLVDQKPSRGAQSGDSKQKGTKRKSATKLKTVHGHGQSMAIARILPYGSFEKARAQKIAPEARKQRRAPQSL